MEPRLIIFDTETTGLKNKQAVEVALMEIEEVDGEIINIGEASGLVKPTCEITPEAQAIHNISAEMLADKPTIEEWVEQTFGGRLDGEVILIGYRIAFDRPLFAPIGDVLHDFDLLELAFDMVTDVKDHKLQTMRDYFQLPGGDAHRAMGDVQTTFQLLQTLVKLSGRSLLGHVNTPVRMIHRMPWGKRHVGKPLAKVPWKYRQWLLSLPDLSPNLRYSLELLSKVYI